MVVAFCFGNKCLKLMCCLGLGMVRGWVGLCVSRRWAVAGWCGRVQLAPRDGLRVKGGQGEVMRQMVRRQVAEVDESRKRRR